MARAQPQLQLRRQRTGLVLVLLLVCSHAVDIARALPVDHDRIDYDDAFRGEHARRRRATEEEVAAPQCMTADDFSVNPHGDLKSSVDDKPQCRGASVDWESSVIISRTDLAAQKTNLFTRLLVTCTSNDGDCVRDCGSITSTESAQGGNIERPFDVRCEPPLYVYEEEYAGAVFERVRAFTMPRCEIDAQTVEAASGVTLSSFEEDLSDFFDLTSEGERRRRAFEHTDASGAGGEGRRLIESHGSAWAKDADSVPVPDAPLHRDMAHRTLKALRADVYSARYHALASRGAPKHHHRARSTVAHAMDPDEGVFTRLVDAGADDVGARLAQMPAIDPDIVDYVVNGTTTSHWMARWRIMNTLQASRELHLRDMEAHSGVPHPNRRLSSSSSSGGSGRNMLDVVHEAIHAPHGGTALATGSGSLAASLAASPVVRRRLVLPSTVMAAGAMVMSAVALGVATYAAVRADAAYEQAENNANKINNEIVPAIGTLNAFMEDQQLVNAEMLTTTTNLAIQANANTEALASVSTALDEMTVGQQALADQAGTNADAIGDIQANMVANQEATTAALAAAAAERQAILDMQAESTAALTDSMNDVRDSLAANIEVVATTGEARDDSQDELFNTFTAETAATLTRTTTQLRSLSSNVRDLAKLQFEAAAQRGLRRDLAYMFHSTRVDIAAFGWTPFLDASTFQTEVVADADWKWAPGSPKRRLVVDTVRLTRAHRLPGTTLEVPYPPGSNYDLIESEYTIVCDAAELMTRSVPWNTWEDFQTYMAGTASDCMPAGIADMTLEEFEAAYTGGGAALYPPVAGTPLCLCWVEKADTSCPVHLDSADDVPFTPAYAGAGDVQGYAKAGIASTTTNFRPCGSSVVTTGGTHLVRAYVDFAADIEAACTHGSLRNTAAAPATPAFYVSSERLSTIDPSPLYAFTTSAPWHNDTCWMDATRRLASDHFTPAMALVDAFESSWAAALLELNHLDYARYGSVTNDVHVETTQFNSDGASATTFKCDYGTFLATQGARLQPVTRMRPVGEVVKRASWFMPPVPPSELGANDGRPAVFGHDTNPSMFNDMSFQLPTDSLRVGAYDCIVDPLACDVPQVGLDTDLTTFTQYLYDVPQSLMSASPDAALRAGTVNYLMLRSATPVVDNPDELQELQAGYVFTRDMWQGENPDATLDPFDAAGTVAGFYQEVQTRADPLGDGDVECVHDSGVGNGEVCSLLKSHYFNVPNLGGRQAYLANTTAATCGQAIPGRPGYRYTCLSPRSWQYRFTAEIPVGVVAQSLVSACPVIDTSLITSIGVPQVTIRNDAATSTTFAYHFTWEGASEGADAWQVEPVYCRDDGCTPHGGSVPLPVDANSNGDVDEFVTDTDGDYIVETPGVAYSPETMAAMCLDTAPETVEGLAPGASVDVHFSSICSAWTLHVSMASPETGLDAECRTQAFSMVTRKSADNSVPVLYNTEVFYTDTGVQSMAVGMGEAATETFQNIDMQLKFLMAYVAPEAAGQFDSVMDQLTDPPVVNTTGIQEAIGAASAASVAAEEQRATEFDEGIATMVSQADRFAADTAAVEARINASLAAQAENNAQVRADVAAARNASDAVARSLERLADTVERANSHDPVDVTPVDIVDKPDDVILDLDFGLPGLGNILGPVITFIVIAVIIYCCCCVPGCGRAWAMKRMLGPQAGAVMASPGAMQAIAMQAAAAHPELAKAAAATAAVEAKGVASNGPLAYVEDTSGDDDDDDGNERRRLVRSGRRKGRGGGGDDDDGVTAV